MTSTVGPPPKHVLIQVEQGAVRGLSHDTYSVFYGIPYAAPPLGAARFDAPSPHASWPGGRDATRPGPTSPQPARGFFGSLDISHYFLPGWVQGADYLTVNVWAPARPAGAVPVLVFLHGGGFLAGSSYSPLLEGRRFAEDGVVVVTVNYRLGLAGFLDIPSGYPNRGLADVLAALEWVQRNIGAFGGDPANVTLGGQSAGAMLTAAAIAAPADARLFHRAVLQSGSGTGAFTHDQAAIAAKAAAAALGVAPTLDGFASVSDKQLVETAAGLMGLDLGTGDARDPLQRITPFGVVLDEQPAEVVARGAGLRVDLLVGHNAEEGNLYLVPTGSAATTTAEDLHATAAYAHPDPARLLSTYSAIHPSATPGQLRSIVLGEAAFGAGTRQLADSHARTGQATFSYEFGWRSPALRGQLGAAHVVETPFVFDNLLPALRGDNKLLGAASPPQALADRMHRAWIDFVTSGSPGWTRYDLDARATMRIGDQWTLVNDPFRAERAAWMAEPTTAPR